MRQAIGLKRVPHWSTLYKAQQRLLKKVGFDELLDEVFGYAQKRNMVGRKEEASVDSTGLDAGHRSTHYAHRCGQKRYQLRNWPKLTLACHNATHLLIDVLLSV